MLHIFSWKASIMFAFCMSVLLMLGFSTSAQAVDPPSRSAQTTATITDINALRDGDLIKLANHHDVYIYKIIQNEATYKRLILNPTIFESYGHLKWENIKTVSPAVLNTIPVSTLVREVDERGMIVGEGKVYHLIPDGDVGMKRYINLTATQFLEAGGNPQAIFNINSTEASDTFYKTGIPITTVDEFTARVLSDGKNSQACILAFPKCLPTNEQPTNDGSSVVRPPSPPKPAVNDQGDLIVPTQDAQSATLKRPEDFVVDDTKQDQKTVIMAWSEVASATSYEMQYTGDTSSECSAPVTAWKSFANVMGSITPVSKNYVEVQGLADRSYQFRVRSVKGADRSAWRCTAKTLAAIDPSADIVSSCNGDVCVMVPKQPASFTINTSQNATHGVIAVWTTVRGADSYGVQYTDDTSATCDTGGSSWKSFTHTAGEITEATQQFAIVKGLEPGTYKFRVRAVSETLFGPSEWRCASATVTIDPDATPPTSTPSDQKPPTSLDTPSGITISQVVEGLSVTWNPVQGATLYRIAYCGGSVSCKKGEIPVVTATANSTIIALSLDPGKVYRVAVIAKAGKVSSKWSSYRSMQIPLSSTPNQSTPNDPTPTLENPPAVFINANTSNEDGIVLVLAWSAVTGISSYEIQYTNNMSLTCDASSTTWHSLTNVAGGVTVINDNMYVGGQGIPQGTYQFRVRSMKGSERSAWRCASHTPPNQDTPPTLDDPTNTLQAPTGLKVSGERVKDSKTKLTLEWTDIPGVSYQIQRGKGSVTPAQCQSDDRAEYPWSGGSRVGGFYTVGRDATTKFAFLTSLKGTTYSLRIRSVQGDMKSDWVCGEVTPKNNPVTNVTTTQTATGLRVTWTPVSGANSYQVLYCKGEYPCTKVKTVTATSSSSDEATLDTTAGIRYRVAVKAVFKNLYSAWVWGKPLTTTESPSSSDTSS